MRSCSTPSGWVLRITGPPSRGLTRQLLVYAHMRVCEDGKPFLGACCLFDFLPLPCWYVGTLFGVCAHLKVCGRLQACGPCVHSTGCKGVHLQFVAGRRRSLYTNKALLQRRRSHGTPFQPLPLASMTTHCTDHVGGVGVGVCIRGTWACTRTRSCLHAPYA